MWRTRLITSVNIALFVALGGAAITGLVASALDLNRFTWHMYAAYATMLFAIAHLALHLRPMLAQLKRLVRGQVRARHSGRPAAVPVPAPSSFSRRRLLGPLLALAAGLITGGWWGRKNALATSPLGEDLDGRDLGEVYHAWSKPTYAGLLGKALTFGIRPPLYKEYPSAPRVELPLRTEWAAEPLDQIILARRSVRDYVQRPLALAELSRLFHRSFGVTDTSDPSYPFRAYPSSGALFPVEVYALAFKVDGLPPGVYHYAFTTHQLELLRSGDFRSQAFQHAVAQEMVRDASVLLALTVIFERARWKYTDRAYRYGLIEAGHIGQNLYLMATSMDLGACGIGAFMDDDLNELIGVDGTEEALLYLVAVGPRAALRRAA